MRKALFKNINSLLMIAFYLRMKTGMFDKNINRFYSMFFSQTLYEIYFVSSVHDQSKNNLNTIKYS